MNTAHIHRYSTANHPAEVRPRLFLVREAAPEYAVEEERSAPDAAPAPRLDASLDPDDELEELGDRCITAYIQADALQYRAMTLLVEFHRREGWKNTGHSSTAHWLAWRLGIHLHTAQERLRTALALEHLPMTSEAMEKGDLSYAKVRTMTRVAAPENEAVLLEHAKAGSAANLDRLVSGWQLLERKDEVRAEVLRHNRRTFSAFVDTDGMVVVRGRLDPEVGAVLMRAVEAATDALYQDERKRAKVREAGGRKAGDQDWKGTPAKGWSRKNGGGCGCGCDDGSDDQDDEGEDHGLSVGAECRALERASRGGADAEMGEATPAQRRADAVGLLAERALAAGFGTAVVRQARATGLLPAGSGDSNPENLLPAGSDNSKPGNLLPAGSDGGDSGNLLPAGSKPAPVPISGTRAERYMVMLHVDTATLSEHGQPGLSEFHDGTRVSAETARRLSCDCSLVEVYRGPDGEVTGAGKRRRTVNPQLRRALEARDRECRFPGCGARFTEAHHVVHHKDGGEATLGNCILLCRLHHWWVHEGGAKVFLDRNRQAVFFTRKGKAFAAAPPRKLPPLKRPGGRAFEAPGVDAWASAPKYNYDRDIPWEEEARAWEALDPA